MLIGHLKVRMLIKPLLEPNSTSVSKRSPTMQMRDLLSPSARHAAAFERRRENKGMHDRARSLHRRRSGGDKWIPHTWLVPDAHRAERAAMGPISDDWYLPP